MVILSALHEELSRLSHNDDAIAAVKSFCDGIKTTTERMQIWNSTHALVRPPISLDEVRLAGFSEPDDAFVLLQGDIIRSESAYSFGERITESPKYAVLNSSCDLIAGRSESSVLLRVLEIRDSDADVSKKLSLLLRFRLKGCMYLPPFDNDLPDVVGNTIQFDQVCQISTTALHMAERVASLSLIGWRVFGSFTRMVFTRANPREELLRGAVDGLAKDDQQTSMVSPPTPEIRQSPSTHL